MGAPERMVAGLERMNRRQARYLEELEVRVADLLLDVDRLETQVSQLEADNRELRGRIYGRTEYSREEPPGC